MSVDTLTIDGVAYPVSERQREVLEKARLEHIEELGRIDAENKAPGVLGGRAETLRRESLEMLRSRVREIVLGPGASA